MKKVMKVLFVSVLCLCCGMLVGCTESKPVSYSTSEVEESEQPKLDQGEFEEDESSKTEMTPEETAALEKKQQESLKVYADMIAEIETEIPELKVGYVVENKDGGKDISIHMNLLESKDATTYKVAELATIKETLLNNNGITDILVFVDDMGKNAGIIIFKNESGRFDPVVNTL